MGLNKVGGEENPTKKKQLPSEFPTEREVCPMVISVFASHLIPMNQSCKGEFAEATVLFSDLNTKQ